jgi:hypothetical protein
MHQPPPLVKPHIPTPKRVKAYVLLLFGLSVLYLVGGYNSLNSASPIIRELTPLRLLLFSVSVVCFTLAGVLFLKKRSTGRALVIVGILVHFAYILYFNIRVLTKDGSPDAIQIGGMVFGLVVILVIFGLLAAVPFTRKFSIYLGRSANDTMRSGN